MLNDEFGYRADKMLDPISIWNFVEKLQVSEIISRHQRTYIIACYAVMHNVRHWA